LSEIDHLFLENQFRTKFSSPDDHEQKMQDKFSTVTNTSPLEFRIRAACFYHKNPNLNPNISTKTGKLLKYFNVPSSTFYDRLKQKDYKKKKPLGRQFGSKNKKKKIKVLENLSQAPVINLNLTQLKPSFLKSEIEPLQNPLKRKNTSLLEK